MVETIIREPADAEAFDNTNGEEASALHHEINVDKRDTFTIAATTDKITEIPAKSCAIVRGQKRPPKILQIFPDSGASICLAGPNTSSPYQSMWAT